MYRPLGPFKSLSQEIRLKDAMQSGQTKIVCEDITKIFIQKGKQRVHVLDHISLDVKENEFVVILGPGQSGKSTLLRIIAGLETPTEGRVLMDGREVKGPGPDRGLVFQGYMLFAWKTVIGNVEMGPKLRGVSKKERREIAAHYIHLVGLDGFENHYPHQLSGGPCQGQDAGRMDAVVVGDQKVHGFSFCGALQTAVCSRGAGSCAGTPDGNGILSVQHPIIPAGCPASGRK